ncbi:MAG: pyridoxamine 5'-phosphate oxidase family protein [Bryobacterales bacterium]
MGRVLERLDERAIQFIGAQKMFFVATAPSGDAGLLNLSPKGLDTFAVLDERTVAYLDLVGSGIETVAHLRQNGRIVVMFCAFEGSPNIMRIHGKGSVIEPGDAEWDELRRRFPEIPGARSIIRVHVERVADTCGFAVPLYDYKGDRSTLLDWVEKKGPEAVEQYKAEKNARSLDGLPGLRRA